MELLRQKDTKTYTLRETKDTKTYTLWETKDTNTYTLKKTKQTIQKKNSEFSISNPHEPNTVHRKYILQHTLLYFPLHTSNLNPSPTRPPIWLQTRVCKQKNLMLNHLIGTPRRQPKPLEFTPIGGRVSRGDVSSDKENATPLAPKDLNRGINLDQEPYADDTAEFSTVTGLPIKNLAAAEFHPVEFPAREIHRERADLINNGMTSIQEQQQTIHEINKENYQLKMELRFYKTQLEGIPRDQRETHEMNVKLQKQLANLSKENNRLRQSAEREEDLRRFLEDKDAQIDDYRRQLSGINQLNHQLDEKDREIENFRLRFADLQQENLRLERNTNEHQQAEVEVDQMLVELGSAKQQILELRQEVIKLRQEAEELKQEAEESKQEAEESRQQARESDQQLKDCVSELEAKERAVDSMSDHIEDLEQKVEYWKSRYDLADQEIQDSRMGADVSQKSQREDLEMRKNIEDLKFKNQELSLKLERSQTRVQELLKNKGNDDHLLREIDGLTSELKQREKAESDLRSQIHALIREKRQNSHNSNEIYEQQIEQLTQNEAKLTELNKKLNGQVAQLKDELFHLNSNTGGFDSRISSLQRQNTELTDQLEYYEQEYNRIKQDFKLSDKDQKQLRQALDDLQSECESLRHENEVLIEKFKSQSNAGISALSELDRINMNNLQSENQNLQQEIISLNEEIVRVKKLLEFEKTNNNSDELQYENRKLRRELELNSNEQIDHLESELKRLRNQLEYEREKNMIKPQLATPEYRPMTPNNSSVLLEGEFQRLQLERDQLLNNLRDIEHRYRNLQTSLLDKNDLLDRMDIQIKDLKRAHRSSFSSDEDSKVELLRAKAASDSKVKQLEIEKETLQKDVQFQIQHYQQKIDELLAQRPSHTDQTNDPVIFLLEKRIEEAYKAKNELSTEVDGLKAKLKSAQDDLELAQTNLQSSQKQTANLHDVNGVMEQNEKLLKLENERLEMKNKTVLQELEDATQQCRKLEAKVNELRALSQRYTQQKQETRFDDLNLKFDSMKLTSNESKFKYYKNLLDGQLKYYKAKLHDSNLKANDLEFMYNFAIACSKNSKDQIRDKCSQLGIRPVKPVKKPPTFAVVAKLVLASVRLKNRKQRAQKRQKALDEIKDRVEFNRDKYVAQMYH